MGAGGAGTVRPSDAFCESVTVAVPCTSMARFLAMFFKSVRPAFFASVAGRFRTAGSAAASNVPKLEWRAA